MTQATCIATRLVRLVTTRFARFVHDVDHRINRLCLVRADIRNHAVFASYLWRPLDIQLALDGGELDHLRP